MKKINEKALLANEAASKLSEPEKRELRMWIIQYISSSAAWGGNSNSLESMDFEELRDLFWECRDAEAEYYDGEYNPSL